MEGKLNEKRIAVVIPAYQVEKKIVSVIESLPDFITFFVVVDDASTVAVSTLLSEVADPRLTLIRHKTNQGVGGAMLTGYHKAVELGAEIMVKVDGDGQMDPRYITQLVQPILDDAADYCKGNRFAHAEELKAMPFWRRVGNLTHSYLTKLASGYWHVFDPTNGYTAMRASTFSALDLSLVSRNYFFETSLLIVLRLQDAVVKDISIPAIYEDEVSGMSHLETVVTFPLFLLRDGLRRIWIQYFLKKISTCSSEKHRRE